MGQVAHLVTRFGESLVVFGASLDGSRLASTGAMGKEISRDGEEHFIEEGCHGFGFILGPLSRVGELAHGVQAALEGDSGELDIEGDGRLLHDTAHEVIGDKMHRQFALDHVGRFAAEHVHVEEGFEFPKVEFNTPALKVECGEFLGRDGGIEHRGHQSHRAGAEALWSHIVADHAHRNAWR